MLGLVEMGHKVVIIQIFDSALIPAHTRAGTGAGKCRQSLLRFYFVIREECEIFPHGIGDCISQYINRVVSATAQGKK